MRIENFLKNLNNDQLIEVRDLADKLIVKEPSENNGMTVIKQLIEALVEIRSRGVELTTTGMITILENNLDAEKRQLKQCWDTAHQAGRFEGKGIAEKNWQTFETYFKEIE